MDSFRTGIEFDIKPFSVPDTVETAEPQFYRAKHERRTFRLSEIPLETLELMIEQFRRDVLFEAGHAHAIHRKKDADD